MFDDEKVWGNIIVLRTWLLKFKLGIEGFNLIRKVSFLDFNFFQDIKQILSINEDLLVDVTLHMSLIWESCSIIAYSSLTRKLIPPRRFRIRIRVHRGWINISDGQIKQFHDWIVQLW